MWVKNCFPASCDRQCLSQEGDHSQFYLVVETCPYGLLGSGPAYELFVYKFSTANWISYPQESEIEAGFCHLSSIKFCHYNEEDSTLYAWTEDHWCTVCVALPRSDMQDAQSRGTTSSNSGARAFKVLKCDEHVLLMTWLVRSVQGIVLQGFIVWKLVRAEESWNWAEISSTPLDLCLKCYNEESLVPPTFMADGHQICAIASSHEFFPPLVYDLELDTWCHLLGVVKNMQAFFTMTMKFDSKNL
ncbi:hypothetical protein L7F22_067373 [Adiantum nelumboides]|nr:hypothetical protein [Adiantum nelumboides]